MIFYIVVYSSRGGGVGKHSTTSEGAFPWSKGVMGRGRGRERGGEGWWW